MSTLPPSLFPGDEEFASIAKRLADAAADAGYRRSANAVNKAALFWAQGLRPAASAGDWLLASGSRGGVIHRLTRAGGVWQCSCEAGESGQECWHATLIHIIDLATGVSAAAAEDDGMLTADDPPPPSLDDLHIDCGAPDATPADDELAPEDVRWALAA